MDNAVDPQQLAERVAAAMWESDRATRALGMRLIDIGPGRAVITMAVREDMLNGHGSCHGGLIATLADSAFAFACNAGNETTVAASFAVDLLAAPRLGDLLTARCHEVSRGNRTGVYDCEVTDERGGRVALFRGRSYAIKGKPVIAA